MTGEIIDEIKSARFSKKNDIQIEDQYYNKTEDKKKTKIHSLHE